MFAVFTKKRGGVVAINVDNIMIATANGKYTTIELDDGTPIDVLESLEEVCAKCQVKNFKENVKK